MHLRTRSLCAGGALLIVMLFGLWLPARVGLAQGGLPTLLVDPEVGVAGNAVKLGGSGFAPGGYVGTVLWDGVAMSTFQIPTRGSFLIDFTLPPTAAPGNHLITICRGSPCLTGPAAQQASTTVTVTASSPWLPVAVAYIYQTDTATAKSFADLLTRHGMAVTLVSLDEVLKTDFRAFALTLVGNDTGQLDRWGNSRAQIDHIADNSKVLGLGEGGYAFFGQVKNGQGDERGLVIGYPRGMHGSALALYPVDAALAFYRTAYNTSAANGVGLQVYADNVPSVAISPTSLGVNAFPIGYEDSNRSYSIVAGQGCHNLWGFTAGPTAMTATGRNLFINAVQHAMSMPCGTTLQNTCQELLSPAALPGAGLIHFDDLPATTPVENYYAALTGVRFENNETTRALTYEKEPEKVVSRPNLLLNDAVAGTSAGVPLRITFDEPKTHVGFYMGNSGGQPINGLLTLYDSAGGLLCRVANPVPDPLTEFIGLYDAYGRIRTVQLTYGGVANSEAIDDLYFAPNPQPWRIQLCQEQADPCLPAAGRVYRTNPTTGGDAFAVDAQGFVLGASAIEVGDQLWGLEPLTTTTNATIYRTSGAEALVSASAFTGEPGTMQLVVREDQPLLVQNLTVAAEWYVQGDPQRAAWLRDNLRKAANYLYSFTDGQFTLGQITVHQSLDNWDKADLRLYLNNVLQPKANIGGIVGAATPDPSPAVDFTYSPGHFFIGSAWNRYGVPPNQPVTVNGTVVPPATMVDDWALAVAHELGHYLLFLFDTYTDVDGNASQELAELCTGTAMGDVYKPSNQNYIFSPDHWQTACNGTEAYQTLQGRTEWETIHLWYPWVVPPTTVVTGPAAPPANLTTVTFVAPSTPPGVPAASQIFDMLYLDNELSSGEARVFTLRSDQIFEQGKPPKNATQVQLIDAQLGDRLCVYDINDHAEGSETPRHQFGCEIIQPGDAELQMTKNVAWGPEVALTQVSTTSLTLLLTQTLPADAQVIAKLYPEHGVALPEQIIPGGDGVYRATFDLGGPVTPVYLQLWVDETPGGLATRREVVADRGTGGSGAFGPAKALGGVLVVSSDGKASFESDQPLELGPGESIAWQSMPGTPPLPMGKAITGQSYRLDAFPASLVATGRVLIEYVDVPLLQAANLSRTAAEPLIHFWDGSRWLPLATTLTTPVNAADGVKVAAAPSQGVGVYAVLLDLGENQIFLPWVQH
ncbi:MAG: hypothetical protein KF832_01690 [Caldilineaceae bacterium]|nr:hypothetical protein [Caldilineaceae bacterium]